MYWLIKFYIRLQLLISIFRVNITIVDRDGEEHHLKGKVGDNLLYLAHRYDIEMEGTSIFVCL